MKRTSETLRAALFSQIEGLQDGSVKPDTAKATAACAMAICKTVDLDMRATELMRDGSSQIESIVLTDAVIEELPPTKSAGAIEQGQPVFDEDLVDRVMKGNSNGLAPDVIARRLGIEPVDVDLILEASR